MKDDDIEIDECVADSVEDKCDTWTSVTRQHHKKVASKRQTTLDAFLFGDKSRNIFISSDKLKRKKARKSITITTRAVTATKDIRNSRRSFGSVVEEVSCSAEQQNISDWVRMSNIMKQAKAKAERTTLEGFVQISPHSTASASTSKVVKPDLESIRCYQDMYPNLNNRSDSDVVLVSVDSIRPGVLPKPFPVICTDPTYGWDYAERCVRLPFSSSNVRDGFPGFDAMQSAICKLLEPLTSYRQIEECIKSYTKIEHFDALGELFETVLDKTLCSEYLTFVVPFMAGLALQGPSLITQPVPLLRRGTSGSITMSQQQAASLLALGFFCTFPSRHAVSNKLPRINFSRLFSLQTSNAVEKLRCVLHYFHMVSQKMPTGILTFRRQHDLVPDWSSMHQPLSALYVNSCGRIEDNGYGMLQVDFANEYIGGGVLSNGCVQEEIRFLICPEMMVSMLLCERMNHNEAIVICGAQRFSDYDGYGSSFRWHPMKNEDSSPRDRFGRLCCELVAIDALPFPSTCEQFDIELVDRELLKPVATGNWGCGVFGGDVELKGLIQLMAASARKRPLCYFAFGNRQFAEDFDKIYKVLMQSGTTVGRLYDMISSYCSEYDRSSSPRLFTYLFSKTRKNA